MRSGLSRTADRLVETRPHRMTGILEFGRYATGGDHDPASNHDDARCRRATPTGFPDHCLACAPSRPHRRGSPSLAAGGRLCRHPPGIGARFRRLTSTIEELSELATPATSAVPAGRLTKDAGVDCRCPGSRPAVILWGTTFVSANVVLADLPPVQDSPNKASPGVYHARAGESFDVLAPSSRRVWRFLPRRLPQLLCGSSPNCIPGVTTNQTSPTS